MSAKTIPITTRALLVVFGIAFLVIAGTCYRTVVDSKQTPRTERSIYIIEIITPKSYLLDHAMLTYQIMYSVDGINQALEFPTKERLENFLVWLSTRGEITGPADDGGWADLARAP